MPKKQDRNLYEKDYHEWAFLQADLLKQGDLQKLDITNLVEEIESLGKSERAKLGSFLMILLMHMLKYEYQPLKRSKSWELSIKHSKIKALRMLKKNPSLKHVLKEIFAEAYEDARYEAAQESGLDEKTFPKTCPWKIETLLK